MATNDLRNWLKLNMLIDKACVVLRQVFQKSWRAKFGNKWSGTDADINIVLEQRQMQKIGKLQRETILTGEVDSWDLTTLRAILTSRDFLNLTAKEANNINYLANIRNKIVHSAKKGITDDELNANWRAASAILVEFGESEAELELLKQESRVGGVELLNKEEPINDVSTLEARRLKDEGNVQFQQENWAESIKRYTQAILLTGIPSAARATLYSNRSAAFLKQKKVDLAFEDAKKTIELWPEWWRGHYRMGQVYTEMNKYKKAEACFDEAYAREPHREEINEARSYVRMKRGQEDWNDNVDPQTTNLTLDDVISEFQGLTTSQVDEEAIKNLLHTKVKNTFVQNWQDCQRGHNCQTGVDGYPRDYKLAAQYYKKAADRGSAEGLYSLARLTLEGKGVEKNMQLGISLFKQAAEKPPQVHGVPNAGVAQAEQALGLFHQEGIGVPKDELAAMVWYERACKHGSIIAANNLALIYRSKGNFVKFEQYLKMAANDGYAKAMLNLAGYYCHCQGNPELALVWCQRARNAGVLGPEIDHVEKSSNDMMNKFKKSGVEEWELENAKTATGLSVKERMERFACQSDPYVAAYIKQKNKILEQVRKSKDDVYTTSTKFPPDQLEKFAKTSVYARELRRAQNHSFEAVLAQMKLGPSKPFPLPLCEKFITELSSCAKIDIMVAQLPVEFHRQACSLVDHLLTQKTTFDEDTRVCYIAMNGIFNLESSVIFLNECIRKYPQNVYFIRSRGQLNAFMQRYEDGIRDINAAIKMDPSRYEYFFDRAGMMRLFCPKVTAEATIEAYKEFLAAAPEDHRMVPESYYGMAEMHLDIAKASVKRNEPQNIDLSAVKHCFNLGVEAERKQMPFFLPYKSAPKTVVEHVIQSMALYELREDHKTKAGKQQSQHDKKSKERTAKKKLSKTPENEQHMTLGNGKSTTEGKARAFRPELSNPYRERVTKRHRNLIASLSSAISVEPTVSMDFSTKPSKVQKSATSLTGLKAITLQEMNHCEDKVYNGYVLAVTIVEDIAFMASMSTVIEDSSGDVLLCAIYNWQHAQDTAKARQQFGIGRKMSIINPYMRMGSMDGQALIRVDDPTSIIFNGFVEKMCRYCCEPNARKSCVKCKACYCDKECQMLDWKRDHKQICGIFP